MSLVRAWRLGAALGRWADGDGAAGPEDPETIRWAMRTAGQLVSELAQHQLWDYSGHPFVRTLGHCVHIRGCFATVASACRQVLTRGEAEAFLRASHERSRCSICQPDIPDPPWVRVVSPGGQVRWRLADDVELP